MPKNPNTDRFHNQTPARGDPGTNVQALPFSDSVDLNPIPKAMRVYIPPSVTATEPTLRFTPINELNDSAFQTLTFPGPGPYLEGLPFGARRLWVTGTTAGLIVHGVTE